MLSIEGSQGVWKVPSGEERIGNIKPLLLVCWHRNHFLDELGFDSFADLSHYDRDRVVGNSPMKSHVVVIVPRRQVTEGYSQLHRWFDWCPEVGVLLLESWS